MICTGVRWLILYISEGFEQKWFATSYKAKRNEDLKINDEGTYEITLGRPVSITHSKKNGFVTFTNDTVHHFTFGTWSNIRTTTKSPIET